MYYYYRKRHFSVQVLFTEDLLLFATAKSEKRKALHYYN